MIFMDLIALTFDVLGKIMIAYTVLQVHFRFWKEHRVDEVVFKEMRKERIVGIIGILFIIIGYLMNIAIRFI